MTAADPINATDPSATLTAWSFGVGGEEEEERVTLKTATPTTNAVPSAKVLTGTRTPEIGQSEKQRRAVAKSDDDPPTASFVGSAATAAVGTC